MKDVFNYWTTHRKSGSGFIHCCNCRTDNARLRWPVSCSLSLWILFFVTGFKAGTWGSGQSAAGDVDLALSTGRSSAARSLTFIPTRRRPQLLWRQSCVGCLTILRPNRHVSWRFVASGRYDLSGVRWESTHTCTHDIWVLKKPGICYLSIFLVHICNTLKDKKRGDTVKNK